MTSVSLTVVSNLQTVKYFKVAGAALLVSDYCLTFGCDIQFVRFTPWASPRIIFMFARYLPFIAVSADLYFSLAPHIDLDMCLPLYKTIAWLNILSILAAEGLLVLRTYVLWERNRRIFMILFVLYSILFISGCITPTVGTLSYSFISPPYPSMTGCYQATANRLEAVEFAGLAIFELSILGLNLCRRDFVRSFKSQLAHTLYQDNILYVISLFSEWPPLRLSGYLWTPLKPFLRQTLSYVFFRRNGTNYWTYYKESCIAYLHRGFGSICWEKIVRILHFLMEELTKHWRFLLYRLHSNDSMVEPLLSTL
ncbi:hypothetical protein SERLADRAFT_480220 [Serpula lacrymans var. lacrymans S7.9]|uniref:DUF6533 domain-containing protein n=1 Tax=Serpula lacrymans var. lacrymans (strain S7.9) TaxID=578457 RepID=F8PCV4_SERL9|nr:uncharacterized protein SERLADRAFT_480220 [Serpula lacrymans var. lacrymans S7.9]EGO19053.1 hypothetical protein SERLADRAFT_480220 [Serpula lacrymans var. lacrymans S7.9]